MHFPSVISALMLRITLHGQRLPTYHWKLIPFYWKGSPVLIPFLSLEATQLDV